MNRPHRLGDSPTRPAEQQRPMTLPSVQPSETRTTKMHATEQNPATTVETLLRSVAASCPVLSPREREVVAYIAAGEKQPAIPAERLTAVNVAFAHIDAHGRAVLGADGIEGFE